MEMDLEKIFCPEVIEMLIAHGAKKKFPTSRLIDISLISVEDKGDEVLKFFMKDRYGGKSIFKKYKSFYETLTSLNALIDKKGLRGAQVYWEMTNG